MQLIASSCLLSKNHVGFPNVPTHLLNNIELPRTIARRLTPLGKLVMQELYNAKENEGASMMPWVVGCRHGDTQRINRFLQCIAEEALISPTDFSMSVHNAIVSLFFIATNNQQTHTALSGGMHTFEHGLLEAYALQKEMGGMVGYVCYDAPLPEAYESVQTEQTSLRCIVLLLGDNENHQHFTESNHKTSLKIDYVGHAEDFKTQCDTQAFQSFIEFLNNDESQYQIHIPGGYFQLQKSF